MNEKEHIIEVLNAVKNAVIVEDAVALSTLSNQTIHTASVVQDPGSITIAVLVYALSKIMERGDKNKIKNWAAFIKKLNMLIDLSTKSLKENNEKLYQQNLISARETLASISPNMKRYITEVLRKASVNKASKIYEHGISRGQTAKLLGLTQWELSEYTGQKQIADNPYNETISVKKRAETALEFFS